MSPVFAHIFICFAVKHHGGSVLLAKLTAKHGKAQKNTAKTQQSTAKHSSAGLLINLNFNNKALNTSQLKNLISPIPEFSISSG